MENAAKVNSPKQERQTNEEKVQPTAERNRTVKEPKTDPINALENTEKNEEFFFPRQLSKPEKESGSTELLRGAHAVRPHFQG